MLGRSNEETNSWFGRLVRSGEFFSEIYLFVLKRFAVPYL